jgi:hypothetical protein
MLVESMALKTGDLHGHYEKQTNNFSRLRDLKIIKNL